MQGRPPFNVRYGQDGMETRECYSYHTQFNSRTIIMKLAAVSMTTLLPSSSLRLPSPSCSITPIRVVTQGRPSLPSLLLLIAASCAWVRVCLFHCDPEEYQMVITKLFQKQKRFGCPATSSHPPDPCISLDGSAQSGELPETAGTSSLSLSLSLSPSPGPGELSRREGGGGRQASAKTTRTKSQNMGRGPLGRRQSWN